MVTPPSRHQLTVATDEIYEKYLQKAITESNALGDELAQAPAARACPCSAPATRSPTSSCSSTRRRPSELQEGVAFYGRAGNALLKSLQRLHVDPMAIYGTNCLKFAGGDEEESRPFLLRELHIVQPKLVVAMGEPSLAFLNARRFPLARELTPVEGELQEYTPTIQGLVTPDIDESLDEQPAKTAFWNAFKVLGEWWSQTPSVLSARASASQRSSCCRGGRDVGRVAPHLRSGGALADGRDHRAGRAAGDAGG